MSIERITSLLTPVFGIAAAWLSGLIGAHIPGVSIPPDQIIALQIAGFTSATAAAIHWIHGRAHYVELSDDAAKARAELAKVRADVAANPTAGPALADIEKLLKAHEGQVEAAIDAHVPLAVGQALKLLFAQLGAAGAPTQTVAPIDVTTPEQAAAQAVTGTVTTASAIM